MLFSRWQKQNRQIQNYLWAIAISIAFFITLLFSSLDPEQMGALAIGLAFFLRFALALIMNRLFGNMMLGVLESSLVEMMPKVEQLLQTESVHVERKKEAARFLFELPEKNLTISLEPDQVRRPNRTTVAVTKIIFSPLTRDNSDFINKLTTEIDQLLAA